MKYIKSLLALALTALLGVTTFAASSDYTGYRTSVASGTPQAVMLSFYDGPTSRGFTWQTDTTVSSGSVWLRQGDFTTKAAIVDSADKTVTATTQSHSGDCTTYKANVSGLSDGLWSYCLGNGDNVVLGQFTVTSSPTGPITIVNVNDVQTKDAVKLSYWQNTVIAITNQLDSLGAAADFILSGGDFIDSTTVASQTKYVSWGVVADVARPSLGSLPWIMASGNHDYSYYGELVGELFMQVSSPAGCHAFDYGNVHVATVPYASSFSDTVKTWLQNDLATDAAQNARWRVVMIHYGPYTTADHGQAADDAYVSSVSSVMTAGKVDLVLQAHDHTYSKTLPYRWSGNGYTTSTTDANAVNLSPGTTNINDVVYDLNPEGTYYVSAGCAGHRVGENSTIAKSTYNDGRGYKTVTGTINVDSNFADPGDNGSLSPAASMFGVLTVDGDKLAYDWYTVDSNGQPELFDTLRVCKTAAASDAGSDDPGSDDPATSDDPTPPSGTWVKYGSQYISYTGDSVDTAENVGGTTDTVLIFKAGGTVTIPNNATARILVVGGGAGGVAAKQGSSTRRYTGNGGNSGAAEEYQNVTMPSGSYNIVVGDGGPSVAGADSNGTDFTGGNPGNPSSISGPSGFETKEKAGGVAWETRDDDTSGKKAKSTTAEAADGGSSVSLTSSITGSQKTYAKGGAGGSSSSALAGANADPNTGNGGGGSSGGTEKGIVSGAGGSGIVVVRITSMVQPAKDQPETFTLTYGKSKVVTTSESIATVDPASSSLVTVTPNGATTTFTAGQTEGGPESFRLLNSAGELIKIVTVSVEDPNKKSVTLFWSEIQEYTLSTEDGSSAEWTATATGDVQLMSNGSPVATVNGSGASFTVAICGYTANGTGKVTVTRGNETVMTYNVTVLADLDEKKLYSEWSSAVKYETAYVGEEYVKRFYNNTSGGKRWRYADGDYNTATRTVYTYTQTDKADVTPNPAYESGKDYTATSQTFEFAVTGKKAGVVKLAGFFGSSTSTSPKHYAATFELTLIEPIDVPAGAALTYTGSEQTGLVDGEGYTVSGGISKATAVGTYVAIVTPKTNYCWQDKTTDPKTVTWTIGKKTVTVTAASYDLARGDAVPDYAAGATYTGFEGSDTKSVLTTPVSFACDYTTSSPFGTYDVVPSGGEAANYTFEYVNGQVRVREAVTISVLPTVTGELTYGQTLANLTLTGGKAVNSSSEEVGGSFSFADTTIRPSVADSGTTPYAIVFTPDDQSLYKPGAGSVVVTVNRKSVTVTADNKNIDEGDEPPTYTATYSGWITGESASVLTKQPTFTCAYAGEAGSYDIWPSGAEADNYSFTYNKGTLTVTAKTVKDRITVSSTTYVKVSGTDSQPIYTCTDTSSSHTKTIKIPADYVATAEILVVGGGGSGASRASGNSTYGGAGGKGSDSEETMSAGTYAITVGSGGKSVTYSGSTTVAGNDGTSSSIECTANGFSIERTGGKGGTTGAASTGGWNTSSSITGTKTTYGSDGKSTVGTNTGNGGAGVNKAASKAGADGIVVVKILSLKKVVTKESEITLLTTDAATDLSAPSAFGAACTWSAESDKTGVATVEVNDIATSTTMPSIKITPVAFGKATITVKNTDKTTSYEYTWTVTVTVAEPKEVLLDETVTIDTGVSLGNRYYYKLVSDNTTYVTVDPSSATRNSTSGSTTTTDLKVTGKKETTTPVLVRLQTNKSTSSTSGTYTDVKVYSVTVVGPTEGKGVFDLMQYHTTNLTTTASLTHAEVSGNTASIASATVSGNTATIVASDAKGEATVKLYNGETLVKVLKVTVVDQQPEEGSVAFDLMQCHTTNFTTTAEWDTATVTAGSSYLETPTQSGKTVTLVAKNANGTATVKLFNGNILVKTLTVTVVDQVPEEGSDSLTIGTGRTKTYTTEGDITSAQVTAGGSYLETPTVSGKTVTITAKSTFDVSATVNLYNGNILIKTLNVNIIEAPDFIEFKGRTVEYKNAMATKINDDKELLITFTDTTKTGILNIPEDATARILVVGGGAGGLGSYGKTSGASTGYGSNGGDAGSVIEKTLTDGFVLPKGDYTITVGAGGDISEGTTSGDDGYWNINNAGSNSSIVGGGIEDLVATGGVAFSGNAQTKKPEGKIDSPGAVQPDAEGAVAAQPSVDPYYAHNGNGAGAAAKWDKAGVKSDITGAETTYGVGGNGGATGDGTAWTKVNGANATPANSGNGGSGGSNGGTGGTGASGIVIVRLMYTDPVYPKTCEIAPLIKGDQLSTRLITLVMTNAAGTVVNGSVAWKDPTATPTLSGEQTIVFTPEDTTVYALTELTVFLPVVVDLEPSETLAVAKEGVATATKTETASANWNMVVSTGKDYIYTPTSVVDADNRLTVTVKGKDVGVAYVDLYDGATFVKRLVVAVLTDPTEDTVAISVEEDDTDTSVTTTTTGTDWSYVIQVGSQRVEASVAKNANDTATLTVIGRAAGTAIVDILDGETIVKRATVTVVGPTEGRSSVVVAKSGSTTVKTTTAIATTRHFSGSSSICTASNLGTATKINGVTSGDAQMRFYGSDGTLVKIVTVLVVDSLGTYTWKGQTIKYYGASAPTTVGSDLLFAFTSEAGALELPLNAVADVLVVSGGGSGAAGGNRSSGSTLYYRGNGGGGGKATYSEDAQMPQGAYVLTVGRGGPSVDKPEDGTRLLNGNDGGASYLSNGADFNMEAAAGSSGKSGTDASKGAPTAGADGAELACSITGSSVTYGINGEGAPETQGQAGAAGTVYGQGGQGGHNAASGAGADGVIYVRLKGFIETPVVKTAITGTLTYGETYEATVWAGSMANAAGVAVEGEFKWDNPTALSITVADSGKEYDVVFTPNDTTFYRTTVVKGQLIVNAREVTVTARSYEKVAGNEDPTFEYDVTAGSLAGSETLVGTLACERPTPETAATYDIVQADDWVNPNYAIEFVAGKLTVKTAVASYSGINYDSVSNAVEAASEMTGGEGAVTVLVDTDEKIVIPEGSSVTIDPNGKETGGVENNGTMDVQVSQEIAAVGNTNLEIMVSGSGEINAVTTPDTSKEVVYDEKEGNHVRVTIQTKTDIMKNVKGDTASSGGTVLTADTEKLRQFLTDNKVEAYTKANTSAEEITTAMNEKQEKPGENKLELWKDYALGITPTTPVQPVAKPEGDTAADGITLAMPEVKAAEGNQSGDYTITYQVVEGETTKATSSDAGSIKVPLATGTYTIKAVFTPKAK